MSKLPSFQFYPGDWLKDPNLRSVSSGARGLWIDMICLMFECDPRGYLQNPTHQPLTTLQISRMTGNCDLHEVEGWLAELTDSGVLSKSATDVIYCRRIVRDEHKRRLCQEAGKKGGGNPTFKGVCKGQNKGEPKGHSKQNPNPSNTNTNSSSLSLETNKQSNAGLALAVQKQAVMLHEMIEKNLGPLLPAEHKTFLRVVQYITDQAREQDSTDVLVQARELLADKIDYCVRRKKSMTDAKRMFVAAVKEQYGYGNHKTIEEFTC